MSHRSIVPRVAQNVRLLEEMRKVTWPSRQETMRLTLVVIVVSLVVGLYVGILDIGLTKALSFIK
jgi:preprotein translocase subunit SecE